jgi:hypothetical protein
MLLFISINLTSLDSSHWWNHTVFVFCDWLILHKLMTSRFVCVVACIRISFLFKIEWYSFMCVGIYTCIYINIYIHTHIVVLVFWFVSIFHMWEKKCNLLSFWTWLILLHIMSSSSIHLPTNNEIHSSLWMKSIYIYMYTYTYIYTYILNSFGCSHNMAIVNNVAVNMGA